MEETKSHRIDIKHKGVKNEQEKRREEFLKRQKEKRREYADHARKIAEMGEEIKEENIELSSNTILNTNQWDQLNQINGNNINSNNNNIDINANNNNEILYNKNDNNVIEVEMNDEIVEEMKEEEENSKMSWRKNNLGDKSALERKKEEFYKKQLMIPERMIDIPSQFQEEWYCVPLSEGKQRCIIIANHGETVARDATTGVLIQKFQSVLPNGSFKTREGPDNYSILDCLWNGKDFQVLDLMCWGGHLYYDCSSDFRFFWLQNKLSQVNASIVTPFNPFAFFPSPCFECSIQGIQMAASSTPSLSGLLFYYKESHYTSGPTPLVCFLPQSDLIPFIEQIQSSLTMQQ